MSHFRFLSLATIATGFGGFLYKTLTQQWSHNFTKVHAQPASWCEGDSEEDDDVFLDDPTISAKNRCEEESDEDDDVFIDDPPLSTKRKREEKSNEDNDILIADSLPSSKRLKLDFVTPSASETESHEPPEPPEPPEPEIESHTSEEYDLNWDVTEEISGSPNIFDGTKPDEPDSYSESTLCPCDIHHAEFIDTMNKYRREEARIKKCNARKAMVGSTPRTKSFEPQFVAPILKWKNYRDGGVVFPHPKTHKRLMIEYNDFVLAYDNVTRTPMWSIEDVHSRDIYPHCKFIPHWYRSQQSIPEPFRTYNDDYEEDENGFKARTLADLFFHASSPQIPCVCANVVLQRIDGEECPRSIWHEFFRYVKNLTKCRFRHLYVLSGALYLPEENCNGKMVIHKEFVSEKKIAVPTHFFKVLLGINKKDGTYFLECYKFENQLLKDFDLKNYRIHRHDLEREAGFLIFKEVPDSRIKFDLPPVPRKESPKSGNSSSEGITSPVY